MNNNFLNDFAKLIFTYPVYAGIFTLSAVFAFVLLNRKRKEKSAWLAYVKQYSKPLKMLCLPENFKFVRRALKENFGIFGQTDDYLLGSFRIAKNEPPHFLAHHTDKHLLSIAPTRTGKGRGLILPNLLDLPNHSVFVIDPKGENALVSAPYRQRQKHEIVIFNPHGIFADKFKALGFLQFQSFNPLAALKPESPNFTADVSTIAEALIYDTGGESSHWTASARGFIEFLIMYLVTEPSETPTFRRLRSIIAGGHPKLVEEDGVLEKASLSDYPLVQDNVGRYQRYNEEVGGVLATADTQTLIFKNEALCAALDGGAFDFGRMKHERVSIYLILPTEYLITEARYLRLVLLVAMSQFMRSEKGTYQVLCMLDEFANLGALKIIENGYGIIAGHGVTLWSFVQNLTQLKTLYPNNWEVFIANSAAVTVSNVNDVATAEYFGKRAGQRQTAKVSHSQGSSLGGSQSGTNISEVWEDILPTSELYAAHPNRLYVFAEGKSEPVRAFKLFYDLNEPFKKQAEPHPMHKAAARGGQPEAVYAEPLIDDFRANWRGKKAVVPQKSWWLFLPVVGTVELAKFVVSVIGLAAGVTGLIYLGATMVDEYVDKNRNSEFVKATQLDQVAGRRRLRNLTDKNIAAPIGVYETRIKQGLANGEAEENERIVNSAAQGEEAGESQEGFDEKEYKPARPREEKKAGKPVLKPKAAPER